VSHLNDPDFAKAKDWCDVAFGPYLDRESDDPEDYESLAYQCRLPRGHFGGHDCPAARDAEYDDPTADLTDLTEIEKFLGEK
jgi:hypothetical protein